MQEKILCELVVAKCCFLFAMTKTQTGKKYGIQMGVQEAFIPPSHS